MTKRGGSFCTTLIVLAVFLLPAPAGAAVETNPPDYTAGSPWLGTFADDQFTNDDAVTDPVLMGPGNDTFINLTLGTANIVSLGAGDDSFIGHPGSLVLAVMGGAGNDSMSQSGFSLALLGMDGDDTITVNGGGASLLVSGGSGDDVITVNSGAGVLLVAGRDGNDNITINPNAGVLLLGGGDGNDTITNLGFLGAARTGAGDDVLVNGGTIFGPVDLEGGNDTLILQPGYSFELFGLTGTVSGGSGSDTLGFRNLGTVDPSIMNNLTSFENLGFFGGETTLIGDWNFSGFTAVYEGSFTLAQGATLSTTSLTVNTGGTANIDGTLTATTGRTDNAGTLLVNGLLNSTVYNTGLVGGAGTISGDLHNSGAVSPGNSIGTLSIGGSYTHGPGATYIAEVSTGGQSDLLKVSGRADLNGGAVLTSLPRALYPSGFSWTILTAAGGIDGTFGQVQGQPSSQVLSLNLNYGSNDVGLRVSRIPYASFGSSSGARATGAGLDGVVTPASGRNDEMTRLLTAMDFDYSAGQIRQTLEALNPEMYATFSAAGIQSAQQFTQGLSRRSAQVREAQALNREESTRGDGTLTAALVADRNGGQVKGIRKNSGWVAWGRALGSWADRDGGDDHLGYKLTTGGAMVGADGPVLPGLRLGIALGAEQTDMDWSRGNYSGSQDGILAGIYAQAGRDAFYAEASVSYGFYDSDAERTFTVDTTSRQARADFEGQTWLVRLAGGYDYRPGRWLVGPIAAIDYLRLDMDDLRESGAGFLNLNVDPRGEDRALLLLGLRAATKTRWGSTVLFPRFKAGWRHDFDSEGHDLTAAYRDYPTSSFSVPGAGQAQDLFVLEADLTAKVGGNLSAYLEGSAAWGSDYDYSGLSAGLEWRF